MSSIGSTINSINSSLLSEINRYNPTQKPTNPPVTTPTLTTASDSIDFSQVGQLFKDLKQLQTSDPAEFKQVVTDAATQLRNAASQATDPQQAGFLNNLADKFQTVASTGNLSAFQSNSSNSLYSPASRHHHHHGGGGAAATTQTDQTQTDQTQNPVSDLFTAQ
jgi:hypothetical protein